MIRDIGFLAWKDPNKWMEAMRGPRWKTRVNKENTAFMKEVGKTGGPEQIATSKLFQAYSDEEDNLSAVEVSVGSTRIRVISGGGGDLLWNWIGGPPQPLAGDLDVTDGLVVYTTDVKEGGRHYKVFAVNHEKTLWTFDGRGSHGLSADVAILDGRVYLLEASGPLQYKWLVSVDLKTGKDRKVHYEEHQVSTTLTLIRCENKCLFLLTENAGLQALYHVGSNVQRLEPEAKIFYPVGNCPGGEPSYFFRREFNMPWETHGKALKQIRLPKEFYTNGIDLVRIKEGIIVHRRHGQRFFEQGGKQRSFWGEIQDNTWAVWNGGDSELMVFVPGCTAVKASHGLLEKPRTIYGGILKHSFVRSADGTQVRWLGVWGREQRPRGLLVIGYGAYGLTTPIVTTRWRPFLEQGFAVGFAFVRGGGDYNDEWAQEGRIEGKERGVEDFEACVRGLQRATGIGPRETCIFGRSAGGYLVGTTVLRNPNGELAAYAYTEAPYVDVLQTASNLNLPLTVPEYLEFGDPAHKIFDFESLLRLSPVGGMGPKGAPGVFVLCRVGLNDRQVYAYESVKWMDALRGNRDDKDKILFLTGGVGHNVHGELENVERAEDFLILRRKVLGQ